MRTANRTWALLLTLALMLSVSCAGYAQEGGGPEDDFYQYVNGAWLDSTELREDRSEVNAFSELTDSIHDTLMADFAKMLESGGESGDPLLDKFLLFYQVVSDTEKRNADGFAPAAADFARIEALKDLDDLSGQAKEWMLDGMPMPFYLYVDQDMADTQAYALNADMASSFLVSPDFYDPDNGIGQVVIPLMKDMQLSLLMAAGFSEEDALRELEAALAFDSLLVSFMPSLQEQNDVSRLYNPTSFDVFSGLSGHIGLGELAQALIGQAPETVNINNVSFFEAFDTVYAPEHFEAMKSWMKVQFLMGVSSLLGDDFSQPVQVFTMLISGAQALPDEAETNYATARAMFADVVGRYYGQTYFGPEAREDVTEIVREAIGVYRRRLENNDWLSQETSEMAVRKLDEMIIRVGYPDEVDELYDLFVVTPPEDGGTLYGNTRAMNRLVSEDQFAQYGDTPNRTDWIATGDTVNAYYYPLDNSINFPAGILSAPFYAKDQSRSANLGGIGVVIGHEISHAFDNNGARFDEVGNMTDWWTQEDYAEFERRSEAMVALFDGIPYGGQPVDGRLTLGENIADAGGISCMLDIVSEAPDVSLTDFFEAYASIWRAKYTPEAMALSVSDVHAPPVLRVNIQCGNCGAFYEAYEIGEEDAMYLPPQERVQIW